MNDKELLSAFEIQSISNEDWSHEYHIRVAAIYLLSDDFETALEKIKSGIQKLNTVNEVPESKFRGFHETLTVAWLKIVLARLINSNANSSIELIKNNPDLLNSRLLGQFYSSDRLMSLQAKANFIEPDLKPFKHT